MPTAFKSYSGEFNNNDELPITKDTSMNKLCILTFIGQGSRDTV